MSVNIGNNFTVQDLWTDILGNIPVDEDEKSELQFLHFPPGTDREDIWHWFEETFDVSIHDLMFPNSNQ